jgi:hypothetical protein
MKAYFYRQREDEDRNEITTTTDDSNEHRHVRKGPSPNVDHLLLPGKIPVGSLPTGVLPQDHTTTTGVEDPNKQKNSISMIQHKTPTIQ